MTMPTTEEGRADLAAALRITAGRATVARDALINIRDLMDANRANRDRPFLWREIRRLTDEALSEFS